MTTRFADSAEIYKKGSDGYRRLLLGRDVVNDLVFGSGRDRLCCRTLRRAALQRKKKNHLPLVAGYRIQ